MSPILRSLDETQLLSLGTKEFTGTEPALVKEIPDGKAQPSGLRGIFQKSYDDVELQVRRRADDVVRITKLLGSYGGVKFTGKQALLNAYQNNTKGGKFGRGLLQTARVISTILGQTAASGTGLHLVLPLEVYTYLGNNRKGLDTGRKKIVPDNLYKYPLYDPIVQSEVFKPINRLVVTKNEYSYLSGQPESPDELAPEEPYIPGMRYSSPKALYELSRKYNPEQPEPIKKNDYEYLPGKVDSPQGRDVDYPLAPEQPYIPGVLDSSPYKNDKTVFNQKDSLRKRIYNADIPTSKEIHVRLKMSQSNRHRLLRAGRFEGVDKVNYLEPLEGQAGENAGVVDIIPFTFALYRANRQPLYLYFRAHLNDLSDSYGGQWNPIQYIGRGETFHNFSVFNRNISFTFKISAYSEAELLPLYQKLNEFVGSTAPTYAVNKSIDESPFMKGNFMRITIGEYLHRVPGFFNSINLSWSNDTSWETKYENLYDQTPMVPHVLDVQCQFLPIHDFAAESGQPFIGKSDIMTLQKASVPSSEPISPKVRNLAPLGKFNFGKFGDIKVPPVEYSRINDISPNDTQADVLNMLSVEPSLPQEELLTVIPFSRSTNEAIFNNPTARPLQDIESITITA